MAFMKQMRQEYAKTHRHGVEGIGFKTWLASKRFSEDLSEASLLE